MELAFHTFFPLEIANIFYMDQNLLYFQLHVINSEKILKRYLIDLPHRYLHNSYKLYINEINFIVCKHIYILTLKYDYKNFLVSSNDRNIFFFYICLHA